MFTRRKLWLLLGGLILALLFLIVRGGVKSLPVSDAITIPFVGYTNAVNSQLPFALFAISNQAAYPIRWRYDWIEVKGRSNRVEEKIVNRNLPHLNSAVLKSRSSYLIAVESGTNYTRGQPKAPEPDQLRHG
jgi:hypothetical protein